MSQSLYTKIVSRCLFPIHEHLKSHSSVNIRQQLEQSQWLSKSEILAARDLRLATFIQDVYDQVPYYKTLFDSLNLKPGDIQSVADLAKLPFLNKAIIAKNTEAIKSSHCGPLTKVSTGGSSGTPLSFFMGKDRVSHDVAQKWRATRWWDVDIGDKEQVVWGSPIELGTQDRVRQCRDFLLRTKLLPAFDLTPEKIAGFLQQIQSYQPRMLFGYPSVFDVLAKYAIANQLKLDNLGIKVVFVTSERLYDHQRATIEQVFGCPVANGYGGRDAGFIAHQCPSGGMHLSAEDIIVEIVDDEGNVLPDGQSGQVVVTHLGTLDFPFIRYKIGDVAKISTEDCACGRGLPMLEDLDGRTTDFVIASNGTMMHGLALIYVLREQQGISEFKVIQHTKLLTQVMLVTQSGELSGQLKTNIITGLKQRLGQDVEINVELKQQIPAEKSGKYRFVISHAVS